MQIKRLFGWNFILRNIAVSYDIIGLINICNEYCNCFITNVMPPNPPMSPWRILRHAQPALLHQVIYARPSEGGFYWRWPKSNPLNKHIVWMDEQKIPVSWQLGLYSLSGKTSYRQISWSLAAARLDFMIILSLWNWTGISAALMPRCL